CSLSNFLVRDGQKDFFQRRRPGGESAQLHAVLARPRQYSPRIAHEVVGGDEVLGAIAKQSCSLNAWCLLGGELDFGGHLCHQLIQRSLGGHNALVHNRDAVAQHFSFFEVVGGQHHGHAVGFQIQQQLPH